MDMVTNGCVFRIGLAAAIANIKEACTIIDDGIALTIAKQA